MRSDSVSGDGTYFRVHTRPGDVQSRHLSPGVQQRRDCSGAMSAGVSGLPDSSDPRYFTRPHSYDRTCRCVDCVQHERILAFQIAQER